MIGNSISHWFLFIVFQIFYNETALFLDLEHREFKVRWDSFSTCWVYKACRIFREYKESKLDKVNHG